MAVRANMQPLIDLLRQWGQAANQTDIFDGVTYWTDQQLQDILDSNSERKVARLYPQNVDETIFTAYLPRHYYPDPDSVEYLDEDLAKVTTTPTYDFLTSEITLTVSADAISGRFVNMWKALADLWGQKAAMRAAFVDNKSGQNSLKSEQEYNHCIERQAYYRNKFIRRHKR